jgi:copper chaperone
MRDITFTISGMSCGHCLNAVSRAVSGIDGIEVRSVRIGQAELRAANHSAANLAKAAIEDAGYKVEGVIDG